MKRVSILVFLWSSIQGAIVVKNVPKETARIGSSVTLLCELMTSEANVIQITWQKESGNFSGTVATTSRTYGQKLLGYYYNRATHSTNTQNVSAITIKSVTPEDEGCFKCIFNLFPLGASTGTTCLKVYEAILSEPDLKVDEIGHHDTTDNLYSVTCTATGRPPPKITWILPENLDVSENYTMVNLNETETVISNFTLRISSNGDMKVTCMVDHPSLSSKRLLSKVINGNRNQDSSLRLSFYMLISISCVVICSVILIIVWKVHGLKLKYKKPNEFHPEYIPYIQ